MMVKLKFAQSVSNTAPTSVNFTISLRFADDIIVFEDSEEQLAEMVKKLNKG